MKRIISIICLALIVTCAIIACKKDNKTSSAPSDRITFGNTSGMNVVAYNTIINYSQSVELDIDRDGENDVLLASDCDGPMMTDYQTIYIQCLNENVRILSEDVEENYYKHYDTVIYPQDEYIVVDINITETGCGKIADDDILKTYSITKLTPCDEGSALNVSDNFYFYRFYTHFYNEDRAYYFPVPNSQSNDTLYYTNEFYVYHCTNFPVDEAKYMGIKLTKDGKSRLGWVKIELQTDTQSQRRVNIKVIETAIQK